jgi:hypothetical protein
LEVRPAEHERRRADSRCTPYAEGRIVFIRLAHFGSNIVTREGGNGILIVSSRALAAPLSPYGRLTDKRKFNMVITST